MNNFRHKLNPLLQISDFVFVQLFDPDLFQQLIFRFQFLNQSFHTRCPLLPGLNLFFKTLDFGFVMCHNFFRSSSFQVRRFSTADLPLVTVSPACWSQDRPFRLQHGPGDCHCLRLFEDVVLGVVENGVLSDREFFPGLVQICTVPFAIKTTNVALYTQLKRVGVADRELDLCFAICALAELVKLESLIFFLENIDCCDSDDFFFPVFPDEMKQNPALR